MDPRIRRLLDLVQLAEGPPENSEDYRHGAEVTIVTESGKRATRYVRAPRGAAITGVGWPEVHAKFDALVPLSGLPPARHKEVRRFLDNFSDQPDVRKLMSLMS